VPLTLEQHERKLHDPALCEQLPIRDYLDNIVVRTNGAFVAGYELKGLASYFRERRRPRPWEVDAGGAPSLSAGTEYEGTVPLRSSGGYRRSA